MPDLPRSCTLLAMLALAACAPKHDERATAPDAMTAGPAESRECSDDLSPLEPDKLPHCSGRNVALPAPPRAFHIASEGGQCVIEGDVCNLEQPFKLSGCGIKDYFTFTPESATAGAYTYQGSLMGARVGGSGDYSIDANGGTLQTSASHNCAGAGGVAGCNGINIRFRLTPIASCAAAP